MNQHSPCASRPVRFRWAALILALTLGEAATADELQYPLSCVVSADGTLYVADRDLPGIWKLDGSIPAEFFRASKQLRTPLNAVRCLAVDRDGQLLAGDSATRQIYRFDDSGKPVPLLKNTTGIGIPMSIAVSQDGTLLVADLELHQIWKVPPAGGDAVKFVAVTGPRGLAVDPQDNIWVVSQGENQLLRISDAGVVEPLVRGRPFQFPHNVVVDPEGVAYLSDGYAKTIWRIEPGGEPQAWLSGAPLVNPVGLCRRGDELLIVDPHARSVFAASAEGVLTTVVSATSENN
jgi:sugar lactone lactonase YvrE